MQIDLKKIESLTVESVRELIASADDSRDSQIRVSKEGIAYVSQTDVGGMNIAGLAFRFETLRADGGWVGPEAARDEDWVRRIHKALRDNWPTQSSSYISQF